MPQLDLSTYQSQVFWLTIIFIGAFIYFKDRLSLTIHQIIKLRRKKHILLEEDLNKLINLDKQFVEDYHKVIDRFTELSKDYFFLSTEIYSNWRTQSKKDYILFRLANINSAPFKKYIEVNGKKYLVYKKYTHKFHTPKYFESYAIKQQDK
jgi:hypothetical protein